MKLQTDGTPMLVKHTPPLADLGPAHWALDEWRGPTTPHDTTVMVAADT